MATTEQDVSRDKTYREDSLFSAPEYRITYGHDHTLQWEPPVGSKELAVALSYHFPLQTDLESKMQAATRKFLRGEQDNLSQPMEQVTPASDDSTSREPSSTGPADPNACLEGQPNAAPALQIFTWDSEMKEYSPRAKRRRYDNRERVKVAANRGFACDQHRRMKMKVSNARLRPE